MAKRMVLAVVVAAVVLGAGEARAQWVVHALGGTVESLQPAHKTMYVITDDGSSGEFAFPQTGNVNVSFDKDVRGEAVGTDKFNGQGHHVVLFYFGDDRVRTAYAVEDVGTGPFVKVTGTVVSYDKHDRTLTVTTKEGQSQKFAVDDKTVVDTADGVATGKKLRLNKGDHVRLLAQSEKGAVTALLVRTGGIDTTI